MLQSDRNNLVMSALRKVRSRGAPQKIDIMSEPEESPASQETEDLNDMSLNLDAKPGELSPEQLRKKKKPLAMPSP